MIKMIIMIIIYGYTRTRIHVHVAYAYNIPTPGRVAGDLSLTARARSVGLIKTGPWTSYTGRQPTSCCCCCCCTVYILYYKYYIPIAICRHRARFRCGRRAHIPRAFFFFSFFPYRFYSYFIFFSFFFFFTT